MSLKTKLFDETITRAQVAVVGLWISVLMAVAYLWGATSLQLYSANLAGCFTATGRLFGLLAVFFALTQFMLMGRVAWVEKPFGLDKLASYHRYNGYMAIACIIVHPILIVTGYALAAHTGFFSQYTEVIKHYPLVPAALIAELLFVGVVGSSIYIVRKHLKFETWYFVHLLVYVAIVLSFGHQFLNGGSFLQSSISRTSWSILYLFVALNVLVWRFGLPTFNALRFGWTIDRVVKETDSTTSVYIAARGIARWKVQPGQFVLVRFFASKFWWQEHPFSVSRLPDGKTFRLTIRSVGDYTSMAGKLAPGTKVLVSGPYGRFTKAIAQTDKRLFIAGGVGITPIRALAEQATTSGVDSILLYGNRTPSDTVLKAELDALSGLKTVYIYSDAPAGYNGETGRINFESIQRLVPDFLTRDIYLCGPPPMMDAIISELTAAGFPAAQLHFERFALHN
jgi:predicted ferric reductase